MAPQPSPLWEGEINLVELEGKLSKTSPELLQCLKNVLPDEEVQKVPTLLPSNGRPNSRPIGRRYFGVKEDNLPNTLMPKVHVINDDEVEECEIIDIEDVELDEASQELEPLKVGKKRPNPVKPSSETFAACSHSEEQEQEEEQGFTCKHCGHKSTNLSDFWNHITVQHAGITDMKAKVDFFIFNLVEDSIDTKSRLVAALHTINFIVEDNYFLSNQVDKCFKTIMEVAAKLEATLGKLDEKKSKENQEKEPEKSKSVPKQETDDSQTTDESYNKCSVLCAGTSLSDQHLDSIYTAAKSGTKIVKMKAFTMKRHDGKRQPSLNLEEMVPRYLEKNKVDLVVVEVGVNEVSYLNLSKDHGDLWREMKDRMEDLLIMTSDWVINNPGLKIVLLDRLPRIDSKVREDQRKGADQSLRMAWEMCGAPENVILESLELQVQSRAEKEEVFGRLRDPGCDGIHLKGEKGSKEFSYRAYKMLRRALGAQEEVVKVSSKPMEDRRREELKKNVEARVEENRKEVKIREEEMRRRSAVHEERRSNGLRKADEANIRRRADFWRKADEKRKRVELKNAEQRKRGADKERRRDEVRRRDEEWRRAEEWTRAEKERKYEEQRQNVDRRRQADLKSRKENMRRDEEEKQRRAFIIKEREEESKRRIRENTRKYEEQKRKDNLKADRMRRSDQNQQRGFEPKRSVEREGGRMDQGQSNYEKRRVAREARHAEREREERARQETVLTDQERRRMAREVRHAGLRKGERREEPGQAGREGRQAERGNGRGERGGGRGGMERNLKGRSFYGPRSRNVGGGVEEEERNACRSGHYKEQKAAGNVQRRAGRRTWA